MTSLVHPLHSLAYRASKLAHSLTPFFFVQDHSENALLKTPQLTIKIKYIFTKSQPRNESLAQQTAWTR